MMDLSESDAAYWQRQAQAARLELEALRADFLALQRAIVGDSGASAILTVEAMRKDAERYRWLRDNPWPPILEVDILLHRNARWDAAIDAAMNDKP